MIGVIVVFTLVFNFMVLNAAIAEEVIKIGHMRPLTGPMAQMSQEMVRSFDWAFERIGYEAAGEMIEIIVGDSEANAEKAIDVARKMVEKDKVALIVGPVQGGEVMPVAAYMNRQSIPHLVTTQEPPPIVLQKMKWTISPGGTEPQGTHTVLLAEQNINMALEIADYVYIISKGAVAYESPPQEIRNNRLMMQKYLGI